LEFAGELAHKEEMQFKSGAAVIGVPDDRRARSDVCQNTELFFQFPIQSSTEVFAGLNLPPGNSHFSGMDWWRVRWQTRIFSSRIMSPATTCFMNTTLRRCGIGALACAQLTLRSRLRRWNRTPVFHFDTVT